MAGDWRDRRGKPCDNWWRLELEAPMNWLCECRWSPRVSASGSQKRVVLVGMETWRRWRPRLAFGRVAPLAMLRWYPDWLGAKGGTEGIETRTWLGRSSDRPGTRTGTELQSSAAMMHEKANTWSDFQTDPLPAWPQRQIGSISITGPVRE